MSDPSLFRLRISFVKQGRLANLSHLELGRAIERSIRRAQLPFAVTQGFSPHMKISFDSALPVGVGSTCEYYDLFLASYIPVDVALGALQKTTPIDIGPFSATYIEASTPSLSTSFPLSTFRAKLTRPLTSLVIPNCIELCKKGKTKRLLVTDYLVGQITCEDAYIMFSTLSKPSGSLRPDILINEILKVSDSDACPNKVLSLMRIARGQ